MDARKAYCLQAAAAATVAQAAARAATAEGEVAARGYCFQAQQGRAAAGDNAPPPPSPRHGQSSIISDGSDAAPDGVDPRDLCGKEFLSDKTMYGHLRSHPKKGYKYKGATPTHNPTAAGGGSVAGAGDANKPPRKVAPRKDQAAAELSINWPVTDKRGRLPLAPADAGSAGSSSSVTMVLESSFSSEEEEAAMILLQLPGQERGPGDEPEDELPAAQQMLVPVEHQMPVAVAEHEHESIPQADRLEPVPAEHVADAQDVAMIDAPEPEVEQPMVPDHVSGAAGALLPMMSAGHVSCDAAVQQADKSAPPVEHMFGIITESSLAAAIEQAKNVAASSSEARDKKGKLVLSDSDDKKPMKKRRLQDIIQLQASAAPQDPQPSRAAEAFRGARPRIPSPASNRKFVCPRCDKKFPTYQALGGHMASHNRANKYGADGPQHQQLVAQLAVARAVQSLTASANTAGTANSGRRGTNLPPPPKEPILLAPPAVHPCSRCELIFRTGQALGGHMRRHWIADKARADAAEARAAMDAAAVEAVAAAEAAVQAAAAEAAQAAAAASVPAAAPRGEPLDFDLNEMPGEE